jgi:hypothetical protein
MQISQLTNLQALRSTIELQPIDGPNGRVFPPTYPPPKASSSKHARGRAEPNGVDLKSLTTKKVSDIGL